MFPYSTSAPGVSEFSGLISLPTKFASEIRKTGRPSDIGTAAQVLVQLPVDKLNVEHCSISVKSPESMVALITIDVVTEVTATLGE